MARDRIEIDIDGVSYSYRQLSPTKATLIFLKLVKIFGPVLGKAYSGKALPTKSTGISADDLKDIPLDKMIEVVADRMDEDEIMAIAMRLLAETAPAANMTKLLGIQKNFDEHFEEIGGMLHMFTVIKEVLVLQYADFFGGIGMLGKSKASPPPTKFPMVP